MTAANQPARRALRGWIWIGAGIVAAGIAAALLFLFLNWPFTQVAGSAALQERFARPVRIGRFHATYFPPGCIAEDVEFLHRTRTDQPPLIHVKTLTIRAAYTGLLRIHTTINDIQVAGLHVTIPPAGVRGPAETLPLTNSPAGGKTLAIGEIAVDGAVLEFPRRTPEQDPFIFNIEHLKLDHVGESEPAAFHASLHNTEPPGEIQTDGTFGPWDDDDPAATRVSGSYSYDHVVLGVFKGIAGNLTSRGKFGGTLGQINVEGDVDVPDFEITEVGHKSHLASHYTAAVNGTNGDTSLTRVETHFGRTTVLSQGEVKGRPGQHGKTVNIVVNVGSGRIEDLLRMFSSAAKPAETGSIRLQSKIELPPGPQPFLRRIRLTGDFGIGGGRFTSPRVQGPLNRLAASAADENRENHNSSENKTEPETNAATVVSDLKGHMAAAAGVATLSNLSFSEPGSVAQINGTYDLLSKRLDMHGVLRTTGKIADTTTGFKAVVLKALTPLLKKKSFTVLPFSITGTPADPTFGLDLTGQR